MKEFEELEELKRKSNELKIQCRMCRTIVKKMQRSEPLTEAEKYHLRTDVPAIEAVRRNKPKPLKA